MATTTIAFEVERRRRGSDREKLSIAGSIADGIEAELELLTRIRFPSPRYQQDPVAFFREILGVEPWSRQIEVIEAVRDHKRVAVRSGHKVSKSHTIAGIALWFYCSFGDARAIMTSTTARQVDQILWRELRMMRARSGRCLSCKLQDPDGFRIPRPCPHSSLIEAVTEGELARTGLKSADFREVVGFTAREAEAVAGISGRNLLYLPDEASGIPDVIFEAIEGNRAGGARLAMFSNPTKNEGEFFEAFETKSHLYHCITISSEETPNVVSGEDLIPGLATRAWIEEKKEEWGTESSLYLIRVKGVHATREDGKIFSVHTIAQAELRWHETPSTGRLFIGIDPAGSSGMGDESAFVVRRGLKMLKLYVARGLNEEGHLVQALALIKEFKMPRESPVVVIDREGEVGSKLNVAMKTFLDTPEGKDSFELVSVRASDGAIRNPIIYHRVRDELTANLEAWFRDGGAILEDTKLTKELHVMEWKQDARAKLKVTPKDVIKKILKRSPDRYDALALSIWEPLSLKEKSGNELGGGSESTAGRGRTEDDFAPALDPYGGAFDPYGGRR